MRLQGHAAVKVPMAFVGKLLAGKQGAAEEVAPMQPMGAGGMAIEH